MPDTIDFGKTSKDYSRHRAGFPDEFFNRLRAFHVGLPEQRLLDLGTGTGTLARGFARRGCDVTGLDPSLPMLKAAQQLNSEPGTHFHLVNAASEASGLAAKAFDVVTAGQCWHWFERSQAAAEVRRLLIPGGVLVIAHFDWLPLSGNVVDATERLILEHNPRWAGAGGTGLHPDWLADVALGGFVEIETFSFDVPVWYSHEAWRGRIRASAGVAASLPPAAVAQFDEALRELLVSRFPEDPVLTPHRVWSLVCHAPLI